MTYQQKLEAVRQACIKANPEIVELIDGCKIAISNRRRKPATLKSYQKTLHQGYEKNYCCQCQERSLCTQGFTSYKCGYCKKVQSWHNGCTPRYCAGCAEKHSKCKYCGMGIMVIGRPIRLADVLLTLRANPRHLSGLAEALEIMEKQGSLNEQHALLEMWNLHKDSLDEQSETTISFLYELLK